MRAFNKKNKPKHSVKNRNIIIKNCLKTKDELYKIFKQMNAPRIVLYCKDKNGNFASSYLWEYNNSLLVEDVLFDVDFNDGEYDFDAYPVFRDWIEFPITNVKLLRLECKSHFKKIYDYFELKNGDI